MTDIARNAPPPPSAAPSGSQYGRAIFGDNQFLGVNHADQSKASSLYKQFEHADQIIEVLGWAYDAGIRDFMFTTHDRYVPVFEEIVRSRLFPGMHFTPCMPYAHKYANAMAERGIVDVVMGNLVGISKLRVAGAVLSTLAANFSGVMKLLVEIEMQMCKGLPIRGVFLQNIMFDLMLGLNLKSLITDYHHFVTDKLQTQPGYITMNHRVATEVLCDQIGLQQPWVCSNFNAGGFRTNPSLSDVAASFASGKTRNIAMSVFASGALNQGNPLEFVLQSPGVDAVLFGSSTQRNIVRNAQAILQAA